MPERSKFKPLGLGIPLLKAASQLGWAEPTPIQAQAIPLVLEGRDLIGQARTGTGKTAAYALPLLESLSRSERPSGKPRVLVLVPTRELAVQVVGEVKKMGAHLPFRALTVYGGAPLERQVAALRKGIDLVVGTPGRLMDLMKRRELDLSKIESLVLDEADRMLDMGFIDDIRFILAKLPAKRQTLLFSATIPPEIRVLAEEHMHDPAFIRVSADELTVPSTEQVFYRVGRRNKIWALAKILELEKPRLALIFCNTKRGCDFVTKRLREVGIQAEAIHGDFSQARREAVLRKFRAEELRFLVASDVAARGLDIEETSHVINFDTPDTPESYVHRIGRTSRMGREGKAITLVTKEEEGAVRQIEVWAGTRIRELTLPEPHSRDRVRKVVDFDHVANAFGMVPLRLDVGSKDGLRKYDLIDFVTQRAKVMTSWVGHVEVGEKESRFEVYKDAAPRVITTLGKARFNGRPLRVEIVE